MSTVSRALPSQRPRDVRAPLSGGVSSANVLMGLAAVLALTLAGLVGFEAANWDRVAPGVTVLGTSVGGLSRQDAAARIAPSVDVLLGRPLKLAYGDRAWNTSARDLGLRLDPADLALASYRVGREGNPASRLGEQLGALLSGRSIAVDGTTDQAALDGSLTKIAREVDRPPRDAGLVLNSKDGTFQYQAAETGVALDVPGSRERITRAMVLASPAADLVVRETPPLVANEQVQTARDQLQRLLGSTGSEAPLTLTFGKQRWPLERAEVLKLVSLEQPARAGQPVSVKLDEASLQAFVGKLAKDVNQEVQNARVQFTNGSLKVLRESRDGRVLDQAATVQLLRTRLLAGERTAEIPVAATRPTVPSDDLKSLGIVELIDRGSTSFAGSLPEKQANIKLAAERLNGVLVPPGGTFSFNKEVGPTTLEAGFQWGFGITTGSEGVKTVPSVAGGICQVATTLFQPVFWSGYPLEERYPHTYWIPAYTSRGVVGLDAAVDSDAGLDFRWINPTDTYVLIQSATDESNLYFALYGTKPTWKVDVSPADISNRTPADPKPVAEPEPSFVWGRTLQVESAREGFDAVVTRSVTPKGAEPRTLKLKTTYAPSRNVTLVGTKGKPATASVEDALAKVVGDKEAAAAAAAEPARATGTPAASATNAASAQAPAADATARPAATAGAAGAAPTATAVPAAAVPTRAPAAATTPPAPAATTVPATAPTPVPTARTGGASAPQAAPTPAPTRAAP
ncbi:MAG: VanW family protein [Chloroflexi bacterium]|nr:VanW family protein [Chloroflexota bacterium]